MIWLLVVASVVGLVLLYAQKSPMDFYILGVSSIGWAIYDLVKKVYPEAVVFAVIAVGLYLLLKREKAL
jgi:hypothetical protein